MATGHTGVLRRLTERLTRSTDDLEAAEMQRESAEVGVVPIDAVRLRARATVSGEIRSVTLRPRDDVPALDVEVWDGTGTLHLVWLGRRRIAGIDPGVKLRATGRVSRHRNLTTIFNPAYEIIGRTGAAHE